MIYKRTWFSNFLWALFSLITGAMLAIYTILFWKNVINEKTGYYTIGFGVLVFTLFLGIYFLINKVIFKDENLKISRRAAIIWETAIVFLICAAGLINRIYLCLQDGGYSVKGAEAVWRIIFIQMLTLLIGYFAVRRIAGKITACVTLFMLAVSSIYTNQIFGGTEECVLFILYLIGLFIVGSFVKSYCNRQYSNAASVFCAVLVGVIIGILVYLDAVSVTLFIFLPGLITGIHNSKEDSVSGDGTGFAVLLIGMVTVSAALILAGMFAIEAYANGNAYMNVVWAWYNLYASHLPINYTLFGTTYSLIECYIQVIFATFLIISYWNSKKVQNAAPWIVMMLLLAPTPLAEIGVLPYKVFSIFIWSVLAGIGLQLSCFKLDTETEEEMNSADARTVKSETVTKPHELGNTEAGGADMQTDLINEEADKKPRFIENPLPLPKKHEHKEMDFHYDVPEDKMKFDIEITEDDDFDIK